MTESSHPNQPDRERSAQRTIQEIAEDFESAWQEASSGGPPPTIDVYLTEVSEPERSAIRKSLEQIDQRYRDQLSTDDLAQGAGSGGQKPETTAGGAQAEPETAGDGPPEKPSGTATTVDFTAAGGDQQEGPGEVGMEELAEDLRRSSAGEPILAQPVSNWQRLWSWCRAQLRRCWP